MADPAKSSLRHVRRLTDAEIELWALVAKSVDKRSGLPLPKKTAFTVPNRQPEPALVKAKHPVSPTAEGYSPSTSQPRPHELPLAPLERRLRQKLMRGRSQVDQVLDLHGLRQADAHARLQQFLLRAQNDSSKVVLVITGKGSRQSTDGEWFESGVLRRLVPHWLRGQDMRGLVIGFEEAGAVHGGSGALLVRVRRQDRG